MKIEVLNALVSAYCRHGKIKRAFQIFSGVPYKSLISWNSIISGFLMNGHPLQGLEQFSALLSTQVKPNAYSLSLVLSICSSMSAMSHGKQVHGYILRHGFSSEVSLGNALVTMYAKCGSLDKALRVFDAMEGKPGRTKANTEEKKPDEKKRMARRKKKPNGKQI